MKTITIKDITISLSDDDLLDLKNQLKENTKFPKWEDIWEVRWFFISSKDWKLRSWVAPTYSQDALWIRPTQELCEASIALAKLIYLRDLIRDWWTPNLNDNAHKYGIVNYYGKISVDYFIGHNLVLLFKDKETRDWFLEAYRDLITQALPLI